MKLFFGVGLRDHFFVLVEEGVVLDLEQLNDRKLLIFSSKQIYEVAFGWGEVKLLFLKLVVEKEECVGQGVDGRVLYRLPQGTELGDK